jgi:hypothetical protein
MSMPIDRQNDEVRVDLGGHEEAPRGLYALPKEIDSLEHAPNEPAAKPSFGEDMQSIATCCAVTSCLCITARGDLDEGVKSAVMYYLCGLACRFVCPDNSEKQDTVSQADQIKILREEVDDLRRVLNQNPGLRERKH